MKFDVCAGTTLLWLQGFVRIISLFIISRDKHIRLEQCIDSLLCWFRMLFCASIETQLLQRLHKLETANKLLGTDVADLQAECDSVGDEHAAAAAKAERCEEEVRRISSTICIRYDAHAPPLPVSPPVCAWCVGKVAEFRGEVRLP